MTKDTFFSKKQTINVNGHLLDLSRPRIMGILNLTPDSFYSGSRAQSEMEVMKKVEQMIADGADIIDIGAYSSRPGADDISGEEEKQRLIPFLKQIRLSFKSVPISVDTFRADVAEAAIEAGAGIINDISGGQLDARMFETVGRYQVPYVLMHMKGTPQNMNTQNQYEDLFGDIALYFSKRILELQNLGVKDIILDPGFGFAKNISQNFQLLKKLDQFGIFNQPILAGLSRKSLIWRTLKISAEEALNGTTFLNTIALQKGAGILRVHDVKEARECVQLFEAYKQAIEDSL